MRLLKWFFSSILGLFAVLIGYLAILGLSVRLQIYNEEIYINALRQSDIYTLSADIAEASLVELSSRSISGAEEQEQDTFGPELSQKILLTVLEELDVAEILQLTLETNITNLTSWLRGEAPELIIFFPKEELENAYGGTDSRQLFVNQFIEVAGLEELPVCPDTPEFTNTDNIDLEELTCVNEQVKEKIETELLRQLPSTGDGEEFNLVAAVLNENAPNLKQETAIEQVITDPTLLSGLNRIKDSSRTGWIALFALLAASLILATLSALLKTEKFKKFLNIYLQTGIFLSITAGVMLIASRALANILIWTELNLENAFLSLEQEEKIIQAITIIVAEVMRAIFTNTLIIGAVISTVTIIGLIVLAIKNRDNDDEDYDDYEEEDDESYEDDEDPTVMERDALALQKVGDTIKNKDDKSFENEVLNGSKPRKEY